VFFRKYSQFAAIPKRQRLDSFVRFLVCLTALQTSAISLCCFASTVSGASGTAKHTATVPGASGVAWRVQGQWRDVVHGTLIRAGDLVRPGLLIQPVAGAGARSITVFLPDGQRVLSECFTPEDCSRAFRVPLLTESPLPFNVHLLQIISTAMTSSRADAVDKPSPPARTTPPKMEEAVVILRPKDDAASSLSGTYPVSLSGMLSHLPNANYTYDLHSLDSSRPDRLHQPMQKSSSACVFQIPTAGRYEITVRDSLNTPRVNVLFVAVPLAHATVAVDFARARKVLEGWNEKYYGWPVHPFLRAYLQSIAKTLAVI